MLDLPDPEQEHGHCPLCGGQVRPLHPSPPVGGPYFHCDRCDLISTGKEGHLDPSEEQNRYLEHDNSPDNVGYVRMFEAFLGKAVLPFSCGGRALEFGCGPGPVLAGLLEKHGFITDLYDPYFFPDESLLCSDYDLVTSTEVFEHLSRPAEVLTRLCRMLRDDGILAVMTHLHPGRDAFTTWWYHRDPTHITFYSAATLSWICSQWPLDLLYSDDFKMATFRKTDSRADDRTLPV